MTNLEVMSDLRAGPPHDSSYNTGTGQRKHHHNATYLQEEDQQLTNQSLEREQATNQGAREKSRVELGY